MLQVSVGKAWPLLQQERGSAESTFDQRIRQHASLDCLLAIQRKYNRVDRLS